jgi:hypothetical protein
MAAIRKNSGSITNGFTMKSKAQSTLEYAVVIICVVAALIAMQIYFKRAKEGNLRQAADSLGEQYAPTRTTGNATIVSYSSTRETTKTISEGQAHQNNPDIDYNFDGDNNFNEWDVYATEVESKLEESTNNQTKNETVRKFGDTLFED